MKHIIVPVAGGLLLLGPSVGAAEFTGSAGIDLQIVFGGGPPRAGFGLDLRATVLFDDNADCARNEQHAGVGPFLQYTWIFDGGGRFGLGLHGGGELGSDRSPQAALDVEVGWSWRQAAQGFPATSGLQLGLLTQFGVVIQVHGRVFLDFEGEPQTSGALGAGLRFPGPFGVDGSFCDIGRPLRYGDHVARAGIRRLRERHHDVSEQAIARAWLDDARGEAASVPAFLGLARDLRALGAPVTLIERARTSARDEVRHTRLCQSLAAARGTDAALARMPLPAPTTDLIALTTDAWRDGCISEGAASRRAAVAATRASDPHTRATQRAIAHDEAGHAELAWDTIRFALERGGRTVRDAVARALSETIEPHVDATPDVDPDAWTAHGRLSAHETAAAWHDNHERATRRMRSLLARELRR